MSLQEVEREVDSDSRDEKPIDAPLASVLVNGGGSVVDAWSDRFMVSRTRFRETGKVHEFVDSSDVDVVGRLLSGCIAAALPTMDPAPQRVRQPSSAGNERQLRAHVFEQCANYEAMRFTRSTVERARVQFEKIGDAKSAQFCNVVKMEEAGHDKLALLDLKHMGLPGPELVARFVPRHPSRVVQLLIDYSKEDSPYGIFGYGYAVERLGLTNTEADVAAIRKLAPPGVEIARCLEVHSSAGVEVEHLKALLQFVSGLQAGPKQQICNAVFRTVETIVDNTTDQEDRDILDSILDEWQWEPFVGVTA